MKKYSVIVPIFASNLSENHPCLFSFEAKNNKQAKMILQNEFEKINTIYHKQCRLISGKTLWKNAVLADVNHKTI